MKHLVFAADHAGFALKQQLLAWVEQQNIPSKDLGTYNLDSIDYPDFAVKLVNHLRQFPESQGVLICGSGVGMSIAANRYPHIRAALCMNAEIAQLARAHNDANVLVLGARFLDVSQAIACLQTFLETPFDGGRHQARVEKLSRS